MPSTLAKARQRAASRSEVVHSACIHPYDGRIIDRFGHEVCGLAACGAITDRWAGTPNEGLEGCQ